MAERAQRGEQLFHPDDAAMDGQFAAEIEAARPREGRDADAEKEARAKRFADPARRAAEALRGRLRRRAAAAAKAARRPGRSAG
jgi:hypothetical protein